MCYTVYKKMTKSPDAHGREGLFLIYYMPMERFRNFDSRRVIITAILAFAAILTAAMLRFSPIYEPASPASLEAPREFYGYVRDMREGDGVFMVIVSEIDFLSGDEAIKQGMRDTGCTRDRITECIPSLNNGFYLRMKDDNLYSYRIASDASISVLKNGASPITQTLTRDEFASHYKNLQHILRSVPFLLVARGSVITTVEQKYIP